MAVRGDGYDGTTPRRRSQSQSAVKQVKLSQIINHRDAEFTERRTEDGRATLPRGPTSDRLCVLCVSVVEFVLDSELAGGKQFDGLSVAVLRLGPFGIFPLVQWISQRFSCGSIASGTTATGEDLSEEVRGRVRTRFLCEPEHFFAPLEVGLHRGNAEIPPRPPTCQHGCEKNRVTTRPIGNPAASHCCDRI